MNKPKKYSGVIVPLVTPLDADLNIDHTSLEKMINLLSVHGAHVFVLGTTGEGVSLRPGLKTELVKNAVRKGNGKSLVFAGISSNSLHEAADWANTYSDLGADAVVATLPAYFPIKEEQMLRYFSELANKISIPLLIYNMPSTVKNSIPLSVLQKLSDHPNIVGFKESERDEQRLSDSVNLWKDREDFSFLLGWAAQGANALKAGADGIVPSTGNFNPGIYARMYHESLRGNYSVSYEMQSISDDLGVMYQSGRTLERSIPDLKLIMWKLGLCQPYVLPPLYRRKENDERNFLISLEKELMKFELEKND